MEIAERISAQLKKVYAGYPVNISHAHHAPLWLFGSLFHLFLPFSLLAYPFFPHC